MQTGVNLTTDETLYDLCNITFFSVEPNEKHNQSLRKMIIMMKEIIYKVTISYKEDEKDI